MTNFLPFKCNRYLLDLDTNKVHKCGTLKFPDGRIEHIVDGERPKNIIVMMNNKKFVDALTDDEVVFLTEKYL